MVVGFRWSEAPLSSPAAPICAAAGYLATVGLLCAYMRGRKGRAPAAFVLAVYFSRLGSESSECATFLLAGPVLVPDWVVAAHNLVLCLGSAAMFVGASLAIAARRAIPAHAQLISGCSPPRCGKT